MMTKGSQMKFLFSLILLILLSLSVVSALQISPAVITVEYTPNQTQEYDLTVINDISKDIVLEVTYESYEGKIEYEPYFSIDGYPKNRLILSAGSSETIHIKMNFPTIEQFGDVRFATIRFYQVPFEGGGDVSATVAIRIPIDTTIPYPAKYVRIEMQDFGSVAPGSSISLQATITNLGQNVIESMEGSFIINNGVYQNELSFDEAWTLFLQQESVTALATLDTTGIESGIYNVSTTVIYDG